MIRLHHVPQSRSMRTLWLLQEIGCPFEVTEWPFDKSMRSPDFLALHPVGRVPALEIDDRAIWETGAIAEVLCERFPDCGLGRGPGDPERVDWLIWLHFAETVSQHAASLTQQHLMLREDWMRSPTVMRLEARRLGKIYAAIEARLAQSGAHLLKSGFSATDIGVGQAVYMARHFAGIEAFPLLTAWYARITARPAFLLSLPGEGQRLYPRDFYPPPDAADPASGSR